MTIAFQPNPPANSDLSSFSIDGGGCGASTSPHFFENGNPHNPEFLLYELFSNVSNCFPQGIGPTKWLCERLKTARNVKFVNYEGIPPSSLFEERSNDSSCVKFPSDGGICPARLLCERLSTLSELRFPMIFRICPSNVLFDRSMVVKMVYIFTNLYSNPFIVTITESWYNIVASCSLLINLVFPLSTFIIAFKFLK